MVNAPAQLATATGLGLSPSVAVNLTVNAQLATAVGAAPGPAVSATAIPWPGKALGLRVDLLLGGTWTDITAYVYQRNPVQITSAGRPDWTSTIQPAQLTLTVNNRDGRFTPKNPAGAYFPNITRNTQIRVFVAVTSTANVSYAGFRFYGEVSEWPPRWDPSGRDVTVELVASGIWRRLSQLQTTLGSAFRRFYANQTGVAAPQAYWPMEDGTGSTGLIPVASAAGATPGTWAFTAGQAGLSLSSSSSFKGSDAIPQLNAAAITFTVPAGGTATNNFTRFLMSVPAAGDSGTGSTNWNLIEVDSAGTAAKFEVYLAANDTLIMQLRNSGGAIIASGTTTTNVRGTPYLVSCELAPSGGNVLFALSIIAAGARTITETISGTLTGATVGAVTAVKISRAMALMDTAVGHLAVFYGTPPALVTSAYPLNGYTGEFALDRFTRICTEMGVTAATVGASASSAAMGPQLDDTFANLLQSIEDTDCGLLYELRDTFGLGYRTNASMANQVAAVTFSYTAAVIDSSLAPAYDDQLTRNNVTATNWTGSAFQSILTTGPMSVLNPPNGIGNGYVYARNVNAAVDGQVAGIAGFLLNVGSVDEVRFPVVTIKMVRASSAALFSAIPNLRIGDYFQITNPPSFLTNTVIKQLVWGYSETLNAKEWTFAFNSVPETPWETGFSPGTIQTAQIPGGAAVASQAPGAGGLASVIANGSITPAMLNQGITIRTLGGNAVTISVAAPPNPNVNDIWINSSTGLISQWNGSAWAAITFNATNTIQAGTIISSLIAAGTIVASNIAAGTITAALLAAGIVVAGIVDATTVQALQYVATGTQGEFLAYSGSPALGNLTTSISGFAGSDTYGNTYAKGIEVQAGGLTLDNQASGPPAVANASVLYSSVVGRPRFLSQSGSDSILQRSSLNMSQWTVGNTTTATIISAPLNYFASEGGLNSEFEITIDGIVTPGAAANTLGFALRVDGVQLGGAFTIGGGIIGAAITAGKGLDYSITFRMSVVASGVAGTVNTASAGIFYIDATNFGNNTATVSNQCPVGAVGPNKTFDTTSAHTLQVYSTWGGTSAGQALTTYTTRLTRRD